jgi:hypothetical protein
MQRRSWRRGRHKKAPEGEPRGWKVKPKIRWKRLRGSVFLPGGLEHLFEHGPYNGHSAPKR